jgi:hypothetical protein
VRPLYFSGQGVGRALGDVLQIEREFVYGNDQEKGEGQGNDKEGGEETGTKEERT